MFIPLTYFCILAVGMMFIPLDAANFFFVKVGEGQFSSLDQEFSGKKKSGGGKGRRRKENGEGCTWIAKRARPNRMLKGFENVDMAIPQTRPVLVLAFYSYSDFFSALPSSPHSSSSSSIVRFIFSSLPFPTPLPLQRKVNTESKTDQEYCRSLILSIILPVLRFLFPADAEIFFAEVVIAWRRKRRMIRREGRVDGGGGGCW